MKLRVLSFFAILLLFAPILALAVDIAPPAPQSFKLHSTILNEDRVIWVRTPPGYERTKERYAVVYQTDAPDHVNEMGSSIDFLVDNGRMPELIIVGIANTDRTRDLTPSHADLKERDGTITRYPTSGGADKFLDFIQKELMPEIEKRYRTEPYRIFAGHSLGGLLAIHTLITRPDLFDAYIAVSPSLQWDDGRTLHQAEKFFAERKELKKTLFFSLASEGNTPGAMGENFAQFVKALRKDAPKGLDWQVERYPDEDHGSTVLRAHYAGLKKIFADWQMPRDPMTGRYLGGLAGIEKHYRELSTHYGYEIPIPEATLNNLGYQLMATKKLDEAAAVFERNVELYPGSANVYDSLGECQEAAKKFDAAAQNYQRAINIASISNDANLPQFQKHLERVTAKAKATPDAVRK